VHLTHAADVGDELVDDRREALLEVVEQRARVLARDQLGGVLPDRPLTLLLEIALRAKREAETEEERKARLQRSAKKKADAEDALEAMIRRSIKLHGP